MIRLKKEFLCVFRWTWYLSWLCSPPNQHPSLSNAQRKLIFFLLLLDKNSIKLSREWNCLALILPLSHVAQSCQYSTVDISHSSSYRKCLHHECGSWSCRGVFFLVSNGTNWFIIAQWRGDGKVFSHQVSTV